MTDTLGLYYTVFYCSRICIYTIDVVLHSSKDSLFVDDALRVQGDYKAVAKEALRMIKEMDCDVLELHILHRIRILSALKINTIINSSTQKLAAVILKKMAASEKSIFRAIKERQRANAKAKALAQQFIDMQDVEKNIFEKYIN